MSILCIVFFVLCDNLQRSFFFSVPDSARLSVCVRAEAADAVAVAAADGSA